MTRLWARIIGPGSFAGAEDETKRMANIRLETKVPAETVQVDLPGRLFVPGDQREAECKITALSPQAASLECALVPASGVAVVLYVNGLGRFEGMVAGSKGNALELTFVCSAAKRERTAEQLATLRDKGMEGAMLRRHERRTQGIQFTRANGQVVSCEIIDISLNGVALKTEMRLPIGEMVLIAQTAGRVARCYENGIGIDFVGKAVLNTPAAASF